MSKGNPKKTRSAFYHLAALELATKGLSERAGEVTVTEMPDLAGRIRAVERNLADIRKALNETQLEAARDPESEVGPGTFEPEPTPWGGTVHPKVQGTGYRTVTSRSAKRTYNTAPILVGIAEAVEGLDGLLDGLVYGLENGLLTVAWRWTPLQKFAQAHGLPMKVVQHPIADDGDLDGPWVGEKWTESVKQEAIRDE